MSLLLDIGQGAGLAGASGVRPFLPPLVAGALARADAGVDFEGTPYEFLEEPWFLALVLAAAVGFYAAERRRRPAASDEKPAASEGEGGHPGTRPFGRSARSPIDLALAALAVALGALLFAGSLEDGGRVGTVGLLAGGVCAALAVAAVGVLLSGARRRVEASAAVLFGVYADLAALVLAGLSILFPPIAFAALGAFVWLLVGARRQRARKFEGLRILR